MIEEMEKHQEKQSTKKEVKETKTQLAKKKEDKESEMDENEFVLNKIKADKFNSVSPQRVDNWLQDSEDELSTQKWSEKMLGYQMLPDNHNNYDLKPYWTEQTSIENIKSDSDEKILQPEIVSDNSPLLLKEQKIKMRNKNQAFLDFQKNLNHQLDIKPNQHPQYLDNWQRRLRLHEENHSIDVNPIITVESSVKSMIFKETPSGSNTVPSSFVDNEYCSVKNRKPSIPDGKSKQRTSFLKNKLTISRTGLSIYDAMSNNI